MGILAIDLGTSSVKIIVFNETGQILAREQVSYKTQRPYSGWAEQDPRDWWQATARGVRLVLARLTKLKGGITGVGLTGQMHGPVLLDKNGRVLLPCILWMDTRAQKEAADIAEILGQERLLALTGNPIVPGMPAAKLLWLRRHAPELHRKVWKVLMPKDFLAWQLTGELATDPTDASGTSLYNLRQRCWADELAELVGVARDALPPVLPSGQLLGKVTAKAARHTGLREGTPVFVGAGDLATAALGNGVIRSGIVAIIIGTAGQLLFQVDQWPDAVLGKLYLFAHVLPESFLGLGTVPAGGASLHWLVRLITAGRSPSEKEISRWLAHAKKVPVGARGLIFLPYLAGTGTPHMDYQAKGAFIGLTESHAPAELVRAVLEGVAYSLRDSLEVLRSLGMEILGSLRMGGGATTTDLWPEVVAGVMGTEVSCVRVRDASAVGAFLLAAVGCGYYEDVRSACETVVQMEKSIKPTLSAIHQYEKGYQIFRRLCNELRRVVENPSSWNLYKVVEDETGKGLV